MSKQDEQIKESVSIISRFTMALIADGFAPDEAVQITCAMLSGSQVYIPFVGLTAPTQTTH